jgi:hypothetical protein
MIQWSYKTYRELTVIQASVIPKPQVPFYMLIHGSDTETSERKSPRANYRTTVGLCKQNAQKWRQERK